MSNGREGAERYAKGEIPGVERGKCKDLPGVSLGYCKEVVALTLLPKLCVKDGENCRPEWWVGSWVKIVSVLIAMRGITRIN